MTIDLEPFERALVNAVQRTGKRLHFRGRVPVRSNTTVTGWM
jgi:hypothetical protein